VATLDSTVGGAASNSYASLAEGTTYFGERLQASAWTGESDPDVQERALIMATRRLDLLEYRGIKSSSAQALKWPRDGAYDEDGEQYATNAIPTFLKHATFELALHFLNSAAESEDPFADDGLGRFDRAKIGPLEVEINHSRPGSAIPGYILGLLAHVRRSSGMVAELERM
jgi:hypothetical protein